MTTPAKTIEQATMIAAEIMESPIVKTRPTSAECACGETYCNKYEAENGREVAIAICEQCGTEWDDEVTVTQLK